MKNVDQIYRRGTLSLTSKIVSHKASKKSRVQHFALILHELHKLQYLTSCANVGAKT